MLIATLIALSATVVVTPSAKPAGIKPICRNPGIIVTDTGDDKGIHPLGSEPPARQIKALARYIDGCNTPIVVNAHVGTPKR